MVLAVTYLPLDINIPQHEILSEHVLDIGVHLRYCVYVFHSASLYKPRQHTVHKA